MKMMKKVKERKGERSEKPRGKEKNKCVEGDEDKRG